MAKKTNVPCQNCGRLPTAKVVFQSVEGMILMHRLRTVKGYFCRDCGLKIKDELNAITIRRGWFSISGLIGSPIFLLSNSLRSKKLLKLGVPGSVVVPEAPAADVARA